MSKLSPSGRPTPWPELPLPGVVSYLFGLTDRTELPGTALVTLLGDAGVGTANARSLIARLRTMGGLASRAEGRTALYRLDGEMAETFHRIAAGIARPEWDGDFHGVLFTVPESVRGYRDKLRRVLDHSGYGQLRSGLMVHPYGAWERVQSTAGTAPHGATVYQLRLSLDLVDARAVAREAWELDRLADQMRTQAARLHSAAADVPTSGSAAVGTMIAALRPALYLYLVDPKLPAELLPDDWPAGLLGQANGALHGAYWPVLKPYLDAVIGR